MFVATYISQMKTFFSVALLAFLFAACNPDDNATREEEETISTTKKKKPKKNASSEGNWKGTFSNGMKGATISFEVDGDELKDLVFEGYWRCEGKLDLTTVGPEKSFTIEGNKVDGEIIEPEDGLAPYHFELHGKFDGNTAEGTLKIENVPAGCTTYKLNWTAEKE